MSHKNQRFFSKINVSINDIDRQEGDPKGCWWFTPNGELAGEITLKELNVLIANHFHRSSIQSNPSFVRDPGFDQFIAELQRVQYVATREGECPSFDLVAAALALAPKPIPVTERLPGPEDFCGHPRDGQGQWCWGRFSWRETAAGAPIVWRLMRVDSLIARGSAWLPWWAIPLPAADAVKVQGNG